jgi:hypothetical protein
LPAAAQEIDMRRHHPCTLSFVCVFAVVSVANLLARQAVTLPALLSAPFPSEMAAAPAGGHVAWVVNALGSRNVWVASAPGFAAHQVTVYAGDDGQEITTLTWAADGRTLLYVRGGGANRQGEIPNPAISPRAAEQAIWSAEVSSSAPRKLATGWSMFASVFSLVPWLSVCRRSLASAPLVRD